MEDKNKLVTDVSNKIVNLFVSNSDYHIKQKSNGLYKKVRGKLTPFEIKKMILKEESIATYQRNSNLTVKWICFDFDIIKKVIGTVEQNLAESHIIEVLSIFLKRLTALDVKYTLEFSGNRGFHVWVMFNTDVLYSNAYKIVFALNHEFESYVNRELVDIDLFPSSGTPTGAYGKGVKLPLSMHQKSKAYSYIIEKVPTDFKGLLIKKLTDKFIGSQNELLSDVKTNCILDIVEKLNVSNYSLSEDENFYRVRKVYTNLNKVSSSKLLKHWEQSPVFNDLASLVRSDRCGNDVRKLISGILGNLYNCSGEKIGSNLIVDLFSQFENFCSTTTKRNLEKTSNFLFPSFYFIKSSLGIKTSSFLDKEETINGLIPSLKGYDDAIFEVSRTDVEVVSKSELKYLFYNDEVKIFKVVYELKSDLFKKINCIYPDDCDLEKLEYYRHIRFEDDKERELITLGAVDRVFTSLIIKKIASIYAPYISGNSYGYQINENFYKGYIFKHWLYQWVQFLSGISEKIDDPSNQEYYIVKTDIKSFYDSIPHDHLERILLSGVLEPITRKLNSLSAENFEKYKNMVSALMRISKRINKNKDRIGMPQGPAYARFLSEIYLMGIDTFMDESIENGDAIFYHRYVDDIFFICEKKEQAEKLFSLFKRKLDLMSLKTHLEKTEIKKISDFKHSFDKYRAKTKYIIDYNHSNFDIQSDYKKNYIMEKYMELVSTDKEGNNDDSFVFSHLMGVKRADKIRHKKCKKIIESGCGRGSLLEKVFDFLITQDLLVELDDIDRFNEIQSSAFISVIINKLESRKINSNQADDLLNWAKKKLSLDLSALKNLAFITIKYGTSIGLENLNSKIIIECISAIPASDSFYCSEEIFNIISTDLNETNDFELLVNCTYKISLYVKNPSKVVIDGCGKIFFAKVADGLNRNELSHKSILGLANKEIVAEYFYQIMCMFSCTKVVNSEVLRKSWELITLVFNDFEESEFSKMADDNHWLINHEYLDVDTLNFNILVTSIVEKSIVNVRDINEIFLRYHQTLVAYYYSKYNGFCGINIKESFSKLSQKSTFYSWIQKPEVNMFPSQTWFVQNLINNDVIMLKNNDKVLIRKQKNDFLSESNESIDITNFKRYGEKVLDYNKSCVNTIQSVLSNNNQDCSKILETILFILKNNKSGIEEHNPNFFSHVPLLDSESYKVFNKELLNQDYLIIEEEDGTVIQLRNTSENFFSKVFELSQSSNLTGKFKPYNFYRKYLSGLDYQRKFNVIETLISLTKHKDLSNCVLLDCSVFSSYTTSLPVSFDEPIRILNEVFQYYLKVHSDNFDDLHLFYIDESTAVCDENATKLLYSIMEPLSETYNKFKDFFVQIDVQFENLVQKLNEVLSYNQPSLKLSHFKKVNIQKQSLDNRVKVNETSYPYEDISLLNITSMSMVELTDDNDTILKSTDKNFAYINEGKVYLCIFPDWVYSVYERIDLRIKSFLKDQPKKLSYIHLYNSQNIELEKYSRYDHALVVLKNHHAIDESAAKQKLENWLLHIPHDYRNIMVNIIAGHSYITELDRKNFIEAFSTNSGSNDCDVVLIKNLSDQNGTHRLLQTAPNEVCRDLNIYSPLKLKKGTKNVCFFADVSISGSQMVKALKYYLDPDLHKEKEVQNARYFKIDNKKASELKEILKNCENISFYFALYTDQAESAIKHLFKDKLGYTNIEIIGRNITKRCFLEDTELITSVAKEEIYEFLLNKNKVSSLINGTLLLDDAARGFLKRKISTREKIGKLDLVARYCSMPKGSLDFLTCRVRRDSNQEGIFKRHKEHGEY